MDINKQGESLKKSIAVSDFTFTAVAERLEISRTQLYNLFKEEVISDYYLKKLKAMGLDINRPSAEAVDKTLLELEMLRENNTDLRELNNIYKGQIEILKKENETLKQKLSKVSAK